jgi:hypothetical protein
MTKKGLILRQLSPTILTTHFLSRTTIAKSKGLIRLPTMMKSRWPRSRTIM